MAGVRPFRWMKAIHLLHCYIIATPRKRRRKWPWHFHSVIYGVSTLKMAFAKNAAKPGRINLSERPQDTTGITIERHEHEWICRDIGKDFVSWTLSLAIARETRRQQSRKPCSRYLCLARILEYWVWSRKDNGQYFWALQAKYTWNKCSYRMEPRRWNGRLAKGVPRRQWSNPLHGPHSSSWTTSYTGYCTR